jgi:beta-lactamase class A
MKTRGRRPSPLVILLLQGLRFSILGVGLAAIAGTILTLIDPKTVVSSKPQPTPTVTPATVKKQPSVVLKQEITALKQKIQALAVKNPKLVAGAFFVDLDNGNYVNVEGDRPFAAASTIKVPVLVAFFEAVDAGKIRLDETFIASKDVLASGSGSMQYKGVNKPYSALETATQMIVVSDNTATNMLIKRLGGKEFLNARFHSWGMKNTVIKNPLPDLEGTNTTSPEDLALLLGRVNNGELISLKSRDRMLGIMQETETRTLLPQGLEKEAIIAHKTGDIGSVLGDAGIVDMPSGKRYLGAVLVQRPHNDATAKPLIQQISKTVYQHLKWYEKRAITAKPSPSPAVSPKPPGN